MSSQEISSYYNLMPDEVSYEEEREADHDDTAALHNAKPTAAELNPIVRQSTILKTSHFAGLSSILKKSDNIGEQESSLDQDDGSRRSRVSFNGRTDKG